MIEFARQVTGSRDVNSTEFDMFTEHPVIDFMPDQRDLEEKGGTMRLGLYPARLTPGSKAHAVYGDEVVYERHRHRFEVNNRYRATLEGAGMILSGQSPDGRLVEIVELRDHPWFVASQFHPEFKSRPERPHPLFDGFVATAVGAPRRPRAGAPSRAPDGRSLPPSRCSKQSPPRPSRSWTRASPRSSRPELSERGPRLPSGRSRARLSPRSGSGSFSGRRRGFADQLAWPLQLLVPTNAVGAWLAVAFVAGATGRTVPFGALRGLVALLAAVAAYYLLIRLSGEGIRSVGAAHAATIWGVVAMIVGPALGAAGATWRRGRGLAPGDLGFAARGRAGGRGHRLRLVAPAAGSTAWPRIPGPCSSPGRS